MKIMKQGSPHMTLNSITTIVRYQLETKNLTFDYTLIMLIMTIVPLYKNTKKLTIRRKEVKLKASLKSIIQKIKFNPQKATQGKI